MSLDRSLGILAACTAAALLGGCNLVLSERPLFTAADEAAAAPLRPGLWRSDDPKCQVKESRPVQTWPSCASWVLVRSGEILELHAEKKPTTWQSDTFVLAAGDPRILQTQLVGDKGPIYAFTAVKPLRLDDQGRIVAFRSWAVQCGPPPTDAELPDAPLPEGAPHPKAGAPRIKKRDRGTLHPLPGLVMDDEGQNCLAREPAPVRAAAVASEVWAKTEPGPAQQTSHWVRDTLP
jgi:hypothetical protein